jgi:HAD superfamily hydrolase (TIGR01450 family)
MWESIKAFLIDCDGVLSQSSGFLPIYGSVEWVNKIHKKKIPFLIASNTTTISPEMFVKKLVKKGFPINVNNIQTPLTILREHFCRKDPGRVFVLGTDQLREFVRSNRITVSNTSNVSTVLMGFSRKMDRKNLGVAIEAIIKNKAEFIALHQNRIYVDKSNVIEPGLGAWVKAIEYATGKKALIIGKPASYFYKKALQKLKIDPRQTAMISDDPISDLCGAKKLGIRTVFVTSGKYQGVSILDQIELSLYPDKIIKALADIPI